ncbi:cobalamin B12-binding domain-containing protein [Thermincola ferriacetica]|uniref:Cobalamin B12-binding domain-containing protein n=1 Tax=Thermincola ferriacetica TaxID=281456 RepID=A0A0L6W052_9FIRM|nr:cobalamin-dependent protein [Thermincola ferriacetica]KNZ68851.1 cobalamin B12-binding domain-containing protein [Thermincola ferriacetica]
MLDLERLTQAVGDLDEAEVESLLKEFVSSNPSSDETDAVVGACQQGMAIVGDLFEKNVYFVGDLIFAGELLTKSIDILKPVLVADKSKKIGTIVLGTVEGDLHDIGKNIFASMVEAAGFEVYDLGIDVPASAFVDKVKEVKPQIVGMSGVLTLALDSMKATVDALKEAGVRDEIKIIIGGNPVTEDACKQIGADRFTTNAAEGVKYCREWVK